MKKLLLVLFIVLILAFTTFLFLGATHFSQTMSDASNPVMGRAIVEIVLSVICGVVGVYCYVKYIGH